MSGPLSVIGAPSSAGAYAPGQEKAPEALRAAGLLECLRARNVTVDDLGNVQGYRWRPDRMRPRAMNADRAAEVARATAKQVASALAEDGTALVLGGDCTVELGTVAGALSGKESIGLVYIDLDTDLNTPESTGDGTLDWMGVAHMLDIDDTDPNLVSVGPWAPMLRPEQVMFFANGNVTSFERRIIDERRIAEVPLADVAADPSGAARSVVNNWAPRFERLLIHLDVDVLDFVDMPLAENTRRNQGLRFEQLTAALGILLQAPNWVALTVTEVNPDHGDRDGATLRYFAETLAGIIGASAKLRSA